MRKIIIFLMALLVLFSSDVAAKGVDKVKDWDSVSGSIKALGRETVKKVQTIDGKIARDRRQLKGALKEIRKKAGDARKRADSLASRLQQLRERETRLRRELEKSQAQMQKIESSVRNNVLQLFAGQNIQPALIENPKWLKRLELMSIPERFPPMADVSFLMDSLLNTIAQSDKIVTTDFKTPVLLRDGTESSSKIMRIGAFQGMFISEKDSGYLIVNNEANLPQCAPYVAEKDEAGVLKAAMNGSGLVPLDISGGKILVNPPEKENLFHRLKRGGMFLWPIFIMGVLGVFLIIERSIVLSRIRLLGKQHKDCNTTNSPAARIVEKMSQAREGDAETADRLLEEAILAELPPLERFLQTLRVFAATSPLLGLLGTVSGIIHTFRVITAHGNGDPALLSGGISEALLTTEMGLIVAVPLLLSHHFLSRRKNTIVLDMETAGAAYIAQQSNLSVPSCLKK